MNPVIVYRNRTTILPVSLGYDASTDVFTSEIRVAPNSESELIATWVVSFDTDGVDGHLILTLDDSVVDNITQEEGWMDIKRVADGEPLTAFDGFLKVLFVETVTV